MKNSILKALSNCLSLKYFKPLIFILLITLILFFCDHVNAQKKYSLGLDAVFFNSLANKSNKKMLFKNDVGLQATFRKNVDHNNFLTVSIAATDGNRNLYNFQSIRLGYETSSLNGLKNMFVLTEIVVRRFYSKTIKSSTITVAPSLGVGYNLKITKSFMLRGYNNFEYNIPNKIVSAFNNLGLGFHYNFN